MLSEIAKSDVESTLAFLKHRLMDFLRKKLLSGLKYMGKIK